MTRHLAQQDYLGPLFVPTSNAGYEKSAGKLHDIALRASANATYKKPKLSVEERANQWMAKHPDVYRLFVKFALQIVEAGRTRFSAKAIVERLRWETAVQGGDDFKIANAVTTYMARRFMRDYPQHAGLFKTTKRK